MIRLAMLGEIGSGKSYVARLFGFPIFNADEQVSFLYKNDKSIFRKLNKPLVIVSGCVAQAESKEMLKREPYIDIVIGPQSYHKLPDIILNYNRSNSRIED